MPYIGRELDRGNYLKLDDISSSFDSSTTTFNLTNGGKAFYPGSAFSILVVLAGVVQEPEAAYQINQAQITFASAPLAGDQFFCIALGVALGVNTPANGSVNGTQLAKPFNYDNYFYLDDANNRVGIATATPQKPLHVVGEGQFDSVHVLGDLTVDGTTTTLDTVVTEVDKLEVGANNNTVGVAITQSGTGDIFNLYDGSTEVFSVRDGGNVGIKNATGLSEFPVDVGGEIASKNSSKEFIGINLTNNEARIRSSYYSGASGAYRPITFYTSDAERLRIHASGKFSFGTGTASAAKYTFNSAGTNEVARFESTDTGAYLAIKDNSSTSINFVEGGGDALSLGVNSVERLRITTSGVGIGSATPQSQFEVHGTSPIIRSKHSTSQKYTQINHNGTDGYLDWSSGGLILRGASNAERLRITSDGKVGIGTNSITHRFHVYGANTIAKLQSSTSYVDLMFQNTGATNGFIQYGNAGDFKFYANSGSTPTLIISPGSPGNVGINETSPQQQLHVHDDTDYHGIFVNGNAAPRINFARSTTTTAEWSVGIDGTNGNNFAIAQAGNTAKLIIDTSGKIGIGDATPENALTIKNIGSFEGDANSFYLGSNFTGTGQNFSGSGKHAQRFFFNNASSNGYLRYENTGATGNAGDAITWQERFRISSSGQIGMGKAGAVTVNGNSPLTIQESDSNSETICLRATNSGGNGSQPGIVMKTAAGGHIGGIYCDVNSDYMRLSTSGTDRVYISDTGNVGVGYDTPSQKLVVKGTTSFMATNSTNVWMAYTYTDNTFRLNYNGAGADEVTVTSDGKFAIGNSSPEGMLTIKATAAEPPTSGTTANSAIQLYSSLSNHMNFGLNTVNGGYGGYIQVSDNNHAANYQLNLNPNGGSVIVGSNVAQAHANMDDLQVGNGSGNRGITISSGTSNYGTVAFGDSADGSGTDRYEGFIEYYHDDNSMRLGTVHQERVRITSTGTLDFKTADGVGINFRESGYINIDSDNDDSNRNFTFYDAKGTGSESILMRIQDTGLIDASSNTTAVALPQGTTAQRPSGSAPYIRKNTTNNALEFYNGTEWVEIITDYFPTGSTILG